MVYFWTHHKAIEQSLNPLAFIANDINQLKYLFLGISFTMIGVITYYTHTGMIVNTSEKQYIEYTVPK